MSRAPDPKLSLLGELRNPSGLLQETSAVFFILLEDTDGHLKNPRPHPTVTELWRELSYYHVQSYKFQDLLHFQCSCQCCDNSLPCLVLQDAFQSRVAFPFLN